MANLYVQAAPNDGDDSFHIQVTGPAFPKGYASGDVEFKGVKSRSCFIPSMRGSSRQYFQLTEDEIQANLAAIMAALHAPYPQYSASQAAEVAKRVEAAVSAAKVGAPKPAPQADEALITKIVKAVLAAIGQ